MKKKSWNESNQDKNPIQKILLMTIGILSVALAAVLVVKGVGFYREKQQEKEWEARHQEVQEEIDSVRVQIEELAGNAEALQAFLDQEVNSVLVLDEWQAQDQDTADGEQQAPNGQPDPEAQGPQEQNPEERPDEGAQEQDAETPGQNTAQSGENREQVQETMSGAIVIQGDQPDGAGISGEEGNPGVSGAAGEGTAGADETTQNGETGQDAVLADVTQQGLENAAEGAIIIDAPPAPKPVEVPKETVSDNASVPEETVSGNGTGEEGTVSGNASGEEGTVSGNGTGEEGTVSGNASGEEGTVSGNGTTGEGTTVSGNGMEGEDTISGNAVVNGQVIPFDDSQSEPTLEQKRKIRSSYLETMQTNGEDRAYISNNSYDFSGVKIACLGDSITEGSNLDKMENYKQYSYPSLLKNILHAEEVYNLGIGGSSYGRYWDNAFVDRYKEIPKDTDIILVMGGTNDGFAASEKELGSLGEKKPRTFYGDVDELMRGLKQDYPEAKIIFATPLPNVLHDYLRNQRSYLLPQSVYVDAVKELAEQYGIDVIDLYNSNLLDTHDAQVISTYMPDGVHGNPAGYQVLAEHMARNIIEIVKQDGLEGNARTPETVSGNGVSVDGTGTVSGNGTNGAGAGTVSGNGTNGAGAGTVSGNGTNGAGTGTVSGNGNTGAGAPEKTLMPGEEKRLEEERRKAEQERIRQEREEAARAAENNKKVAEDALVIPPAQESKPETEAGTANGQAGTAPDVSAETVGSGPETEYEYGGEAIVIQ